MVRLTRAPADVGRRALIIVACLLVTGCGPSSQKEAEDARTRAGSWAMTIKVVVEQWAIDVVPRHFLQSTLTAADDDLKSESERVRKKAGASAAQPLDAVRDALPPLQQMVARSDRGAALAYTSRLVGSVRPSPVPPRARPPSTTGAR